MKTIFATDLDRTMIYSNRFDVSECVGVETYNGSEISYMTERALDILRMLNLKTTLIPTTTRSVEQFKRVRPFQNTEWAITSNGGTILHYGEVYEPWHIDVHMKLREKNFDTILTDIGLESAFTIYDMEYAPRLVDGVFYYMKIKDGMKTYVSDFLKTALPDGWSFTIQGIKLYIIPTEITKESALAYLIDVIAGPSLVNIITAGDGELDVEFLKLGDTIYIPQNTAAADAFDDLDEEYEMVESSPYGAEDILEEILEEL